MAANDLSLKVTANISSAQSKLRELQKEIASLRGNISQEGVSDLSLYKYTRDLEAARGSLRQTKSEIGELKAGLSAIAGTTHSAGLSANFLAQKFRAITDEFVAGRWAQMNGSIAGLVITTAEASRGFLAGRAGLAIFGGEAVLAAAYFGNLALNIAKFKVQSENLFKLGAATGSTNITGDLDKLQTSFLRIPGVSKEAAEALEAVAVKSGVTGAALGQLISTAIQPLAEITGKDVPEAMKEMTAALEKPASAGKTLVESFGQMTLAEQTSLKAATDAGDKNQQQAVILGALARILQTTEERIRGSTAATTTFAQRIGAAGKEFLTFGSFAQVAGAYSYTFRDALSGAASKLLEASDNAKKLSASLKNIIEDAAHITLASNPMSQQLEDSANKADRLAQALGRIKANAISGGDLAAAAAAIKTIESGSAAGDYGKIGPYNRSGTDRPYGAYQVMGSNVPDWTKQVTGTAMTPEQFLADKAAQDAVFLAKFGEYLQKFGPEGAARAWLGGEKAVNDPNGPADVNGTRPGAYGERFSQLYAQQGGNLSASAGEQSKMNDALRDESAKRQQIKEQIVDQNNARSGGSAIEKERLATLQAIAAGHENDVVAAQRLVDADDTDLNALKAIGSTLESSQKYRDLAAQRGTDLAKLNAANFAVDKSRYDLAAARAKERSPEEKAARLGSLDVQIKAAGDDEAKRNPLLVQRQQLEDQYQKQQTENEAEQEKVRWNAEKKALETSIDNVQLAVEAKVITEAEGAKKRIALINEEMVAEKAHYTTLAQLYSSIKRQSLNSETAEKQREAQRKADETTANGARAVARVQIKEQERVLESYRQTYGEIASIIGGALVGMIGSQQKLLDAARQVSLGLINMFASAAEKMAADWLALQTKNALQAFASQQEITAATVAGIAARMSAEGGGAIASAAVNSVAVMKAIFASAGETFAGIFGFLAPVMGPAAAGPAGAGMATVLGVAGGMASFAKGSWELPRDMIAQVHKGEMIVPAGPAAAIRNGAGAGAGADRGQGAGGSPVFNIHYSAERGTTMDTLRAHSRAIAKMVSEEVSRNRSLRPSY
ncbi:hypothetical protein CU048_12250 [Beijerinckiaceae bacterium]|nr:hypothetical protein CU048_12250 [Beijerinckiaceae bacterium]